jgi:hypothetical protein
VEPLGESGPFGATVDLVRLCPPDSGCQPLGIEKEAERGEGDAGVLKPDITWREAEGFSTLTIGMTTYGLQLNLDVSMASALTVVAPTIFRSQSADKSDLD